MLLTTEVNTCKMHLNRISTGKAGIEATLFPKSKSPIGGRLAWRVKEYDADSSL